MNKMNGMNKTLSALLVAATCFCGVELASSAPPKKGSGVYATVKDAVKAGPDFLIQGEYEGTVGGDAKNKIGVQVIALGGGQFQAVFLPGGLPGAGWDEKTKILCQGKLGRGEVVFGPAKGERKYIAKPPEQFCATEKFPPEGQKACTAVFAAGRLTGKTDTGKVINAKKVLRKSPTLGAKPPSGATVLLAYKPGAAPSLDEWANTRWKTFDEGFMRNERSGSNQTRKQFEGPWKLHVEFMSPFQPGQRGQGRGNSGVFPPGGREVQVLDSFGLAGMPNECGGIYSSHRPRINMCFPPLSWQTYDITYHPAAPAADGKKGEQAYYEVVHNGVMIHKKVKLGGGRKGALSFQDHGNPVSYRNVWIVKATAAAALPWKQAMEIAQRKAKAGQYAYIIDHMLAREFADKMIEEYGAANWRKAFQKDRLERLPYYFGWLKNCKVKTDGGKVFLSGEHGCYAEYVRVEGVYLIAGFGQRLTSM